MKFNKLAIAMGIACGIMLTGCNDNEDSTAPVPESQLQTFALTVYLKPIFAVRPTACHISKLIT
ncbi:hypothetical protein [Shewanella putrefaciens]|uniref:hypothetical protein n=1 Tax=Shewanella putrefaciens TaxID=24 RepID=UPI003F5B5973